MPRIERGLITNLVVINCAVYLLYNLLALPFTGGPMMDGLITRALALPASLQQLVWRPWTLITYMFFHQDLLHLLFNMLWLIPFARLAREYYRPPHILWIYLLGGMAGGILYIAVYNIIPYFWGELPFALALGASGATMAIMLAAVRCAPNREVALFGILAMRLKWLALGVVVIDALSIAGSNAGGHLAHLGGAGLGWWYASIAGWLPNSFSGKPRPKRPRSTHKKAHPGGGQAEPHSASQETVDAEEIERILEKLAKGGYGALTFEEKQKLFMKRR